MYKENIELISWNNNFSSGFKLIDDQHKKLIDLVNEILKYVSASGKHDYDYFNKIIQEVVIYTKVHFSTEEKIMLITRFNNFTDHKKEHENFIHAIIKNTRDCESGKMNALSSFTGFLKEWILSHITMMDNQYFDHFKKIATYKDDGMMSISLDNIPEARCV